MGDNGSTSPYIPRAVTRGYSSILGSVLYSPWIWSTSYALAQDEQTPELMYRDAVVAHAFQHRKLLVTGSNWHLEPASAAPVDKHVAGVVEALLRRVSRFAQARFNLAEGVIRGSSWAGIRGDWTWRSILGDQARRWWAPTELVDVDTRRFRQRRDGEEARYTWEIDRYFPRRWEAIDLRHYLHHVVDDFEGTAGQGRGLMDLLWPYWRNKAELLKLWLQRLDRWALGNIFAKVSLDEEGRRDPNASTMVASWLDTLNKMRAGHVCVYDSQDEVELVETQGDGSEIRAAIDYVDEAMVRLSLGATLPTGGGKGAGSYARADVELAGEDLVELVQRQVDPVVRHPVLLEVVGTDLLGATAAADLVAALVGRRRRGLVLLGLGGGFLLTSLGAQLLARGFVGGRVAGLLQFARREHGGAGAGGPERGGVLGGAGPALLLLGGPLRGLPRRPLLVHPRLNRRRHLLVNPEPLLPGVGVVRRDVVCRGVGRHDRLRGDRARDLRDVVVELLLPSPRLRLPLRLLLGNVLRALLPPPLRRDPRRLSRLLMHRDQRLLPAELDGVALLLVRPLLVALLVLEFLRRLLEPGLPLRLRVLPRLEVSGLGLSLPLLLGQPPVREVRVARHDPRRRERVRLRVVDGRAAVERKREAQAVLHEGALALRLAEAA